MLWRSEFTYVDFRSDGFDSPLLKKYILVPESGTSWQFF